MPLLQYTLFDDSQDDGNDEENQEEEEEVGWKIKQIEKTNHGKSGYWLSLDIQNFGPHEITVKTVDDVIVIEAKHEERQHERSYRLPEGFKIEDVVSSISSDGILTVTAIPATQASEGGSKIQVQQTGPVRLNGKNEKECVDGNEIKI